MFVAERVAGAHAIWNRWLATSDGPGWEITDLLPGVISGIALISLPWSSSIPITAGAAYLISRSLTRVDTRRHSQRWLMNSVGMLFAAWATRLATRATMSALLELRLGLRTLLSVLQDSAGSGTRAAQRTVDGIWGLLERTIGPGVTPPQVVWTGDPLPPPWYSSYQWWIPPMAYKVDVPSWVWGYALGLLSWFGARQGCGHSLKEGMVCQDCSFRAAVEHKPSPPFTSDAVCVSPWLDANVYKRPAPDPTFKVNYTHEPACNRSPGVSSIGPHFYIAVNPWVYYPSFCFCNCVHGVVMLWVVRRSIY